MDDSASMGEFLRAACLRELDSALTRLSGQGDRDLAVHEARKSIRRVRAWLRLLKRDRREQMRPVDQALRSLRRTLGPLRDAASRLGALQALARKRDTSDLKPGLLAAIEQMKSRKAQLWRRFPRRGLAFSRLREGLAEVIRGLPAWPLHDVDSREVRRGLTRAYGRAEKAGRACYGTTGAVRRHAWRGKLRVFLLQAQLTGPSNVDLEKLKALVQAMGNENDLAQVERAMARTQLDRDTKSMVRKYARSHRNALATRIDARAKRLLKAKRIRLPESNG
jgi:CHAD domain-containing protein